MPTLQAIPTRHAGCHFRSRLEARWAVFFDAAHIRWEYEPQGYLINDRPYLPDFYLPDHDVWVEVKGHEAALDKPFLNRAAAQLGQLMVLGPIPEPPRYGTDWYWPMLPWAELYVEDDGWGDTLAFGGYVERATLVTGDGWPQRLAYTKVHDWTVPVLGYARPGSLAAGYAYTAARSARFEHGAQR